MSTDIGTLLSTGVVILGALGGTVGYFAKSRGDSIIKYQAIEITNRDATISRLEKDNAALQSENRVLRDQNNKLGELAQGSPQLETLTKAIETLTNTVSGMLKSEANS